MIKKFKSDSLIIVPKGDMVKISIGKATKSIPIKEFWGIAFSMTQDKEMKDKLIPVRQEDMMHFKKVHTVQVKKDMKAGETLTFTHIIDVPLTVIDGFRDILRKEVPGSEEILKEIIPLQTEVKSI
jgi:hypothetical protein